MSDYCGACTSSTPGRDSWRRRRNAAIGAGNKAERSDEEFGWLARDVWNQTSWEDRSKAMMVFTGSLIRQGYGDAAILDLLYRLDERMGKFLNRPDRDKRLREMLEVTLRKLA